MKIWGHRGARGYAPENTMASFQKALFLGVYGIELDIHMSKDGELVICHDHTLDRTSNGQGYIHNFTLKELKKLDFGSWFDPKYHNEKILTLKEFFAWFTPTQLKVNIEIKNGPLLYAGIEKQLLTLLENFNIQDRVIISSFYHPSLKLIKQINPAIKTGVLFECRPVNPCRLALEADADFMHPFWQLLDQKWIDEAKQLHIGVNTYTVNLAEAFQLAADLNLDGVFSDYPDRWL